MVACAGGHHAPGAALGAEDGQLVQRAADLERAGALQALGLEQHPAAGALAERRRRQDRSPARDVGDRAAGAFEVLTRRFAGHQSRPESATTASISTCAPFGSAPTPIATRAGGSEGKNVP